MLIAQISDTHIETARADASQRLDDLARTVRSINALPKRPDIVLHTGDVAHDASAADYTAARTELARLEMPVYATVGNRDRRAAFFDAFARDGYLDADFGFAQYAADLGGLMLVAVDTLDSESALGGFCEQRAAHLSGLLARAAGKPTLVFAHHPPLELPDMKAPALQYRDAAEAQRLVDVVSDHAGLVGVVTGHVHRARAVPLGPVTLTTVPCIAADLSREKSGETYLRRPIYHLHRLAAGRLTTQSVMLEGAAAVAA